MKTIHIVLVLLLAVVVSAAYVVSRPAEPSPPLPIEEEMLTIEAPAEKMPPSIAPAVDPVVVAAEPEREEAQTLEERGDAMLFEIDALQNMPFDQSITMPFD